MNAGKKILINGWSDIYQLSLLSLSLEREIYLLRLSIFRAYILASRVYFSPFYNRTQEETQQILAWCVLVQSTLSRERERLALLVYFSIRHPRFLSLFQLSLKQYPGRYRLTFVQICISQVYSLQGYRKTCFVYLYFEPTSQTCGSILIQWN